MFDADHTTQVNSQVNSKASSLKRPEAVAETLGRVQAALSHHKRAATPFVLAEAHTRLFDRLAVIKTEVLSVAMVGAGYAEGRAALVQRYPGAALIDCSLSAKLQLANAAPSGPLARIKDGLRLLAGRAAVPRHAAHVCAPDALPLASDSVDLLWANLAGLAWGTPASLLAEWQRVVKPGGFVMFSALGPDSARQAAAALAHAGTAADRSRLIDMHDWGDALLAAGLSDPVMDAEVLTLQYTNASALLAELRALLPTRPQQTGLKNNAKHYRAALENAAPPPLNLTIELVFGHAFKVARLPRQATVSLDSLKASLPSQKQSEPAA